MTGRVDYSQAYSRSWDAPAPVARTERWNGLTTTRCSTVRSYVSGLGSSRSTCNFAGLRVTRIVSADFSR